MTKTIHNKAQWLSAAILAAGMAHTAQAVEVLGGNDSFATASVLNNGITSDAIGDQNFGSGNLTWNDVDVYKFTLGAGDVMSATISSDIGDDQGTNGPFPYFSAAEVGFAPQMVLFFDTGAGHDAVASNGEFAGDPGLYDKSLGFTAASAGDYYLMISAFGNAPTNGFGSLVDPMWHIPGFGFTATLGNSQASFDYDLNVSGITAVVPVPAAVWLFGSALAGLGVLRRRQQA